MTLRDMHWEKQFHKNLRGLEATIGRSCRLKRELRRLELDMQKFQTQLKQIKVSASAMKKRA